jgi:hypothetical protein
MLKAEEVQLDQPGKANLRLGSELPSDSETKSVFKGFIGW